MKCFFRYNRLAFLLFGVMVFFSCETTELMLKGLEGENTYMAYYHGTDHVDLNELKKLELPGFSITDYKHPKVKEFIKVYSTHTKRSLQAVIDRSALWSEMIRKVFQKEGIPEAFTWLPIIESGYNSKAISPAGAAGLWQFMYGTGKVYGLDVDYWYDERMDPYKATIAAAYHIKYLYKRFKDWTLVLAAYNAGAGRVSRALKKYKAGSFWDLYNTRALKKETKEYVPKFIASVTIALNPGAYGFNRPSLKTNNIVHVEVHDAASITVLAKAAGLSEKEFKDFNPSLLKWATPPRKTIQLHLPEMSVSNFHKNFSSVAPENRVTYRRYMIRIGDTLSGIAYKFRVPVGPIVSLNRFRSKHRIAAGNYIFIPIQGLEKAKAADRKHIRQKSDSTFGNGYTFLHEVRKNESLFSIAKRYNVTLTQIFHWNHLKSSFDIQPGRFLMITVNP